MSSGGNNVQFLLRGLSVIKPTLIDINEVDKIMETPASIMQYNSTTPRPAASKMIIQLNQRRIWQVIKYNKLFYGYGT